MSGASVVKVTNLRPLRRLIRIGTYRVMMGTEHAVRIHRAPQRISQPR